MKKLLLLLQLCCLTLLVCGTALAAEETAKAQAPMNWEISMQPKPTAEELEAARWSLIVENDIGVYAYDMESLGFVADEKGNTDKNVVCGIVKTVFTNKDVLKNVQKQYADKLNKKEKVQYCTLLMQFDMQAKAYTVREMRVFTDKDREIEVKRNNNKLVSVPEKSFAEAMYEICQKFVAEVNGAEAAKNTPEAAK